MAYTKYSLTPANNTAAPPDGAPEGMLPSAVNDTMRDMMAQIRDCGDGIRDGTYTMTAAKITGGTITGSTINNSAIGGTTAAAGKFTTLEATGATTFSGATVVSASLTANTFSSSGATITGGSINNATIGASTPSTGAFTTSSLKGSTSGTITLDAPAVAGTNTATFPAATGTVMVSGNMPTFSAYADTSATFTSGTTSKVAVNTILFDTANCFNTSTNRFTPNVAGYYQINGKNRISGTNVTGNATLYKNGSQLIIGSYVTSQSSIVFSVVSTIAYLNGTTDYIELYGYGDATSGSPSFSFVTVGNCCEFSASLVRAA